MPYLDDHRKATGEGIELFFLESPFSFFDFIETRFGDYDSIHRIFSLARSFHAAALVLENIPPFPELLRRLLLPGHRAAAPVKPKKLHGKNK